MEKELKQLKEELTALKQAYTDNISAGGVSSFRKGDLSTGYRDLEEKIRRKKQEIALLEANI